MNFIKNTQAIIFDMDGVLADSEPLHFEAEMAACQKYGFTVPLSEWKNFHGKTSIDIFKYIVANYGQGAEDAEEIVQYKTEIYLQLAAEKVTPIEGAIEFAKWSRKKFPQLALVTSSNLATKEMFCNKFSINNLFDVVITAEDITQGKPNPEPYAKAIEKLGTNPKNCIVIEDSANGILSAKGAGANAIGIMTSLNKTALGDAGADLVVANFLELQNNIESFI